MRQGRPPKNPTRDEMFEWSQRYVVLEEERRKKRALVRKNTTTGSRDSMFDSIIETALLKYLKGREEEEEVEPNSARRKKRRKKQVERKAGQVGGVETMSSEEKGFLREEFILEKPKLRLDITPSQMGSLLGLKLRVEASGVTLKQKAELDRIFSQVKSIEAGETKGISETLNVIQNDLKKLNRLAMAYWKVRIEARSMDAEAILLQLFEKIAELQKLSIGKSEK